MAFTLETLAQIADAPFDDIIDVRSPSEYAEDHVPGAISLPVLDDAERARVGTIYVQESRFLARKIGAALVARNAAAHIEGPLADRDGGWKPLVYCWRGGQRSGSFATILRQIGWQVEVLEGGYRSYRRAVVDAMYHAAFPAPVIVLDGNTGTAKTDILGRLPGHGVQVIDLEGLANHRGSLFGALGDQPSQKAFEGAIALAAARLDPARPVVVEAESSKIGEVSIPPALWSAMKDAPRIHVEAPLPARARFLASAYADVVADPARLDTTLDRLVPLQGHDQVAEWKALATEGAFESLAASLMERHYDPRYHRQRARMEPRTEAPLPVESLDEGGREDAAARIAALLAGLSKA
ncbi:MAG: tRNA 2-selenouridine(34) synthase MnmH [Rubricella sp.]